MRATLALPGAGNHAAVERGGPLTPYEVEEIVEDALHAGAGASLDMCIVGPTADAWVARLRDTFARLGERGVAVRLRGVASGAGVTP